MAHYTELPLQTPKMMYVLEWESVSRNRTTQRVVFRDEGGEQRSMADRPWGPQHLPIDGHQHAYVRGGSGEPLLLIHGITTSSFIWDSLLPILGVRHDVIAVDLLGTGDSDRPVPADCSLAAHAERLVVFIDKLDLDRVHLVGHDIGGGVAQIVSVRNPHRVATLGLVNTVGYDYWPVQPIVAFRTPILRQLAMASLDLGMLRLVIRRAVHRRERITPEIFASIRKEIAEPKSRRAFLNSTRCLNNSDLTVIADALKELPENSRFMPSVGYVRSKNRAASP